MTNEQAEQIIQLLKDIREQVARTANATARDGNFVLYSDTVVAVSIPPHPGAYIRRPETT